VEAPSRSPQPVLGSASSTGEAANSSVGWFHGESPGGRGCGCPLTHDEEHLRRDSSVGNLLEISENDWARGSACLFGCAGSRMAARRQGTGALARELPEVRYRRYRGSVSRSARGP